MLKFDGDVLTKEQAVKVNIIGAFCLVGIVVGVALAYFDTSHEQAYTPPFLDGEGNTIPGSIAVLEKVVLNGVPQWILMRGKNADKPILLFLHGGPGFSNMPFVKLFQTPELEENFIVVQWDQRGAGKSYSEKLTEQDMRVEMFVEDVRDLTHHLCARFGQKKIFMLGHSWGSALGFMTIAKYPELYHAYVAAGEAVDWNKRQARSFAWTFEQAQQDKNQKALDDLQAVVPFDPTNVEHISVKNKVLETYGGEYHQAASYQKYVDYMGQGPEYTAADFQRFEQGARWSDQTTEIEVARSGYSLFRDLPEVQIPVYFFAGRYDYQTPSSLAEDYYKMLKAPDKGFVWFEESAHYTYFMEPDKATRELILIAKKTLKPG